MRAPHQFWSEFLDVVKYIVNLFDISEFTMYNLGTTVYQAVTNDMKNFVHREIYQSFFDKDCHMVCDQVLFSFLVEQCISYRQTYNVQLFFERQ